MAPESSLNSNPLGKNLRVWGVRGSLIGDSIMALPILNWVERQWPGSYKHWQIARKCAQAAPIYLNHPLIDRIVISDGEEGMGPADRAIAETCQVQFDLMPRHPTGDDWPNHRNIYEETWVMAGLALADYHTLPADEQRPKLVRWFDVGHTDAIAIWPFAGYGKEPKRSPSREWYISLIERLRSAGFQVLQYGHPRDPLLVYDAYDRRGLSFFDQVKETVGCDLVISTDSGSGLIFAAYEMPQVTILANHWPGHTHNLTAFAPLNPNGIIAEMWAYDDAALLNAVHTAVTTLTS